VEGKGWRAAGGR